MSMRQKPSGAIWMPLKLVCGIILQISICFLELTDEFRMWPRLLRHVSIFEKYVAAVFVFFLVFIFLAIFELNSAFHVSIAKWQIKLIVFNFLPIWFWNC